MKQRFLCLLLSAVLLLSLVSMASAETPTAVITTPQQAAPGVSLFSTGDSTAGHHLTGNEKVAYEALLPLVEEIATGQRNCTVLSIGQVPNSAKEDYHIDKAANFTIAENGQFYLNTNRVLHALMADCPFEMYWYDKTNTGGCLTSSVYWSTMNCAYVTFYFNVEDQYYDKTDFNGKITELATANGPLPVKLYVDQNKITAVRTAVEKASAIVKAAEDLDDYSKLLAYKNEICDLVSYNHDAANNNSTPYGDPWQLIYVFDGDPKTNVVCEGYSKAFQYLCDNTEFQSDLIQCYTVSGQMYAVSPGVVDGGGHMWNIVTMEDGKHYLVDVTNSDEESIGWMGGLFLAGTPITTESFNSNGETLYLDCHKFSFDSSTVFYMDADDDHDGKLDYEDQWDDKVLTLSDHNYVYEHVCDYTKAEIDVGKMALVLPAPVRENETVYAVVYENGKMVDMKVMRVGESTMDISDLHGDEIKAFFLNSSSKAPLAPNQKENWDH